MTTQLTNDSLLRRALRGNGIFSTVSGIVFLAAAAPVAAFMGLNSSLPFTILGVGLIGYALLFFWQTNKEFIAANFAIFAIVADVLWVIGSWALILFDPFGFTVAGKWAVGLIAEAVFVFAVVQYIGLRRLSK